MSDVLSRPGVPALDPLEFARGTLCAMSFVATEMSRETHVTRLGDQFERAGLAESMDDSLNTLRLLREAEPLDNGYWIPAPTRVVELADEYCLLIGPQPTAELQRHFASARRVGAGRVVGREDVPDLPLQALADWRGSDGHDASAWARSTIRLSMEQFAPSVIGDGLEAFGTLAGNGRRPEPAWVQPGDSAACTWRGVGLFRARTGAARYRYFLGRYRREATFLEGPKVRESLRMQFGLAALQNRSLTVNITQTEGAAAIALPLRAPATLRCLLVALCDAEPRSFGRVWVCSDSRYLPVLLTALLELKCETAHHEGTENILCSRCLRWDEGDVASVSRSAVPHLE